MKRILPIALVVAVLSGCGVNPDRQVERGDRFVTIYVDNGCHVVYDTETGVEYWESTGAYNYGSLYVLVDEDGNPLIYDGWR